MDMAEKNDSQDISHEDVDSKTDPDPNVLFPYTDVGLEVEGKILYVSKGILINKSPVFKKMFESDFQEMKMNVIQLPEKKLEDMGLFLKCLCPFIDHPITVGNVMQILPLACEYIAKEIIAKCENVICNQCMEYSASLGSTERDDTKMEIRDILDYLISYETFKLDDKVLQAVAEVACFLDCATLEAFADYNSLSYKTKWMIATKRLNKFEQVYKSYNRRFRTLDNAVNKVADVMRFLFQFQKKI